MGKELSHGIFFVYKRIFRADGRTYIGEYNLDKKEGYGEFYWYDSFV